MVKIWQLSNEMCANVTNVEMSGFQEVMNCLFVVGNARVHIGINDLNNTITSKFKKEVNK
jgi:hypothetical protein